MEYDQICHLLASYGLLVSFFGFMRRNRVHASGALIVSIGLALSIGLFKEYGLDYQPEIGDIVADFAGVGLGSMFTLFLF